MESIHHQNIKAMKQRTRELLLTTKAAKRWQDDFDRNVDELMLIVGMVDSEQNVYRVSETMDIYGHKQPSSKPRKRRLPTREKPFEFLVFRN